jgi:hypothetical protein
MNSGFIEYSELVFWLIVVKNHLESNYMFLKNCSINININININTFQVIRLLSFEN